MPATTTPFPIKQFQVLIGEHLKTVVTKANQNRTTAQIAIKVSDLLYGTEFVDACILQTGVTLTSPEYAELNSRLSSLITQMSNAFSTGSSSASMIAAAKYVKGYLQQLVTTYSTTTPAP